MYRAVSVVRSGATAKTLLRAGFPASAPLSQQLRAQIRTQTARPRVLAITKPAASTILWQARRQATTRGPVDSIDEKAEARIEKKTLKADPESVSTTSTINPPIGISTAKEEDTKMMAGISADLQTIRDTFSLQDVPRQAYYVGLAGVLPYMATSLSTVYCAYEINRASEYGTGLFMTERYAELLLHAIEPLQVGYGAVIISFLGAIHWGLEWAAYGGIHGYSRYAIGVVSTAVAWPTILMPVEYALITQFLVFNFLYYADSRATRRGWAPPWYAVYRFVLTFIVGGSIVLSLIGRGQIADRIDKPVGHADRFKQLRGTPAETPVEEYVARAKYLGDEGGDDDEEGEDDDE